MKHVLTIGAILAVFVLLARKQIFSWPYYYDEADYMYAASLGLKANYTDHPAQSLAGFLRAGFSRGADPSQRASLSSESRMGSDVNFYRHWHGPLYFYWLMALAPLHLEERATRAWSYVFPAMTMLLIYCGSLWLLPDGYLAAVLSSTLYLWSYTTTLTNEIAPHQLFVLCYIAALLLLMKWRITGAPRYWYGAVVAAACAFCTLEVAFVLLFVMLACAWPDRKLLGKSLLLFSATVLLVWPAAVLKLSFVKAYLFMAYLAVFRKSPWGDTGFLETWRFRFANSPVEWTLLALAVALYFCLCDPETRRLVLPVFLYAGGMLVVLLRVNSETPRYMLPYLPALQLAAGFTFASILNNRKAAVRNATAAAICLLVLCNTAAQIRAHPIQPAPRLSEVLASVREQGLFDKKLLVPQNDLPMLHYYFPRTSLRGYATPQEQSALLQHERFQAVLQRDKTCFAPTSLLNDER